MSPDLLPGQGVFVAALQWLQGTLLGSVATAIAVIAVAWVGMSLLSGRIDIRRGLQVIFGCFILFGASTVAAALVAAAQDAISTSDGSPEPPQPPQPIYADSATSSPAKAAPYDPYAGAALPTRP